MNIKYVMAATMLVSMTACSANHAKQDDSVKITYSNMADETSLQEVRNALADTNIPSAEADTLLSSVNEYNMVIKHTGLTQDGFQTVDAPFPVYEPDLFEIAGIWSDNASFTGTNCRITTFTLLKNLIQIDKDETADDSQLFLDHEAIEERELFNEEELSRYNTLFARIPVEQTKDTAVLAKTIESWLAERHLSFQTEHVSMISVFMMFDDGMEQPTEFIGHTGVLLEQADGLLFIEKLSMQEPYQAIRFKDKTELNDYLMRHYDAPEDETSAEPILFENEKVMAEYRSIR